MIENQNIKNLPFDESIYQIIEFSDYFYPNQNKKVKVQDLGRKFTAITSFFYEYIKEFHIPCAFIKIHGKDSLVFVKYEEIPFRVKILNSVDKRTAKLFNIKEGQELSLPIFEFHYGDSKNSIVSESHLITFDLCTNEDIKSINRICSKVNAVLKSFFERRHEIMGEFICSFGKYENKVYLVDDFTPLSLKVLPMENNGKNWQNPYAITNSSQMRKYTDHLFKITTG